MAKKKTDETKVELSIAEKHYIATNLKMHPEELSRNLQKPIYLIKKFLNEHAPERDGYVPNQRANLFATTTVGGKKGVCVMTEAASQDGDDKTSPRMVLRARIQRALNDGLIDEANRLQLELESLPAPATMEDRYADCVTSTRRKLG
jgi:hypothetical protein